MLRSIMMLHRSHPTSRTRGHRAVLATAALAAAALVPPAAAQTVLTLPARLDLGETTSSPVATGYTQFVPGARLPLLGFAWIDPSRATGFEASGLPTDVLPDITDDPLEYDDHPVLEDLFVDGHDLDLSTGPLTFKARIDDGILKVRVRVVLGNPLEDRHGQLIYTGSGTSGAKLVTTEHHPWDDSEVWAGCDTSPVDGIEGVWTRTLSWKAQLEPGLPPIEVDNHGGFRSFWFDVDVVQIAGPGDPVGEVMVTFDSSMTTDAEASVVAIEIYPETKAPARINAASPPQLVVASGYTFASQDDEDDFTDAVAALNAGDPPATVAGYLDDIEDDATRAIGRLWLAGWLGSDRPMFAEDGVEWEQLTLALEDLDDADADDALVAESIDRARAYRRALLHHRLRGSFGLWVPEEGAADATYADPPAYPTSNYEIIYNLGIAEALWRDVATPQLDELLDASHLDVGPLAFKAAIYMGINHWQRQTKNLYSSPDEEDVGDCANGFKPTAWYFINQHFEQWRQFRAAELVASQSAVDASTATAGTFQGHDALAVLDHLTHSDGTTDGDTDPDFDQDAWGGVIGKWPSKDQEGFEKIHGSTAGASGWWTDRYDADLACSGDWYDQQFRYRDALTAAHRWWVEERLVDGGFGGGSGDDPEFVLQQVNPTVPFRTTETALEAAIRAVVDANLEEWEDDGFHGNGAACSSADVEHTGEYTGNLLWAALQLFPGDPYYLEYAMRSTERITTPTDQNGVPWTALVNTSTFTPVSSHETPDGTSITPRYIRSWHIDAEGASLADNNSGASPIGDTPLNGRAFIATYYLNAYNRHPVSMQLMREIAEWRWAVAMDDGALTGLTTVPTGQQKPVGLMPPAVTYIDSVLTSPPCSWTIPTDAAPGGAVIVYGDPKEPLADKLWWEGPKNDSDGEIGNYDFKGTMTHSQYTYGLFLWRFLDPETPDDERYEYLLPIYLASRYLAEYQCKVDQTCTGGKFMLMPYDLNEGSNFWIADQMRKSENMLWQVFLALPFLDDDELDDLVDDYVPITDPAPSDGDLKELIEDLLVSYGPGYAAAIISDDLTNVESSFEQGFTWINGYWPLFTTFGGYMDRVAINQGDGDNALFASTTGGPLLNVPSHQVQWEPVPDSNGDVEPLAVALHVEGWDETSGEWTALLQQFETGSGTEREVDVRFMSGFPVDNYEIQLEQGGTGVGSPVSFSVDGYGGVARLSLPWATGTCANDAYDVVVTPQTGEPTWSDFADLALTASELDATFIGSGQIQLEGKVHNLGTATPSSVTAQVRVRALADDPGSQWSDWETLDPVSITLSGLTTLDAEVQSISIDWDHPTNLFNETGDDATVELEISVDWSEDRNAANDLVSAQIGVINVVYGM